MDRTPDPRLMSPAPAAAVVRRRAWLLDAPDLLLGWVPMFTEAGPRGPRIARQSGVSCYAEYAVVDRGSIVVIDPSLPLDVAALFGCAVVTGVGAVVNTAQIQPGSSVAVVGLGGVGLSGLMGAVLVSPAYLATYFIWIAITRLWQAFVLFGYSREIHLVYPLLLYVNQFGQRSNSIPLTIGWQRDSRDSVITPLKGRSCADIARITEAGGRQVSFGDIYLL